MELEIWFFMVLPRYRNEIKNKTYIFNPGECAGILKGKNQVGIISLENKQMDVVNF